MTEPFKISWGEPTEGPLPKGSKVRRDTGLVGELVTDGYVRKSDGGLWILGPTTQEFGNSVTVNAGGQLTFVKAWAIDGVGMRDDGLLWVMPQRYCYLPDGIRLRFADSGRQEWRLLGPATYRDGRVLPGHRAVAISDGSVRFVYDVSAIGFPRAFFSWTIHGTSRCDYCGDEIHGLLKACAYLVGGISYSSCCDHNVSQVEFLRGALRLRHRESPAGQEEQVLEYAGLVKSGVLSSPGAIAGAWESYDEMRQRVARGMCLTEPDPVVVKPPTAPLAERRAAKVAKLAEALRQPFAPRFQAEEPFRDGRRR